MTCQECHLENRNTFDIETCRVCHATENAEFMAEHQDQFVPSCLDCHDGVDRMSNFEHANFFPLKGHHAEIDCEGCHTDSSGKKVYIDTPTECSQCHFEPEIHAGFFGLKCQYCHSDSNWTPARLTMHPFPLDHGGREETDCQSCHLQSYAEYTCYGCHEHQEQDVIVSHTREGVTKEELPNCFQCHPNGLKKDTSASG